MYDGSLFEHLSLKGGMFHLIECLYIFACDPKYEHIFIWLKEGGVLEVWSKLQDKACGAFNGFQTHGI